MREMRMRALAYAAALTRVAIGAALTAAPDRAGRLWAGFAVDSRSGQMLMRGLGIRDLALGLGMVTALRRGRPLRPWSWYAVACDVVDAAASAAAHAELPDGGRISAPAIAAAAVGDAFIAARLD